MGTHHIEFGRCSDDHRLVGAPAKALNRARHSAVARLSQVMIVPFDDYVKPEGQQVKEGSRKSLRKLQYKPRHLAAVAE